MSELGPEAKKFFDDHSGGDRKLSKRELRKALGREACRKLRDDDKVKTLKKIFQEDEDGLLDEKEFAPVWEVIKDVVPK